MPRTSWRCQGRRRHPGHLRQIDARDIAQLTHCKAIGRFGLGVDNIDLPAAKEKGIAVNYVPDYCIREVSDHAMALLLALIRKIPLSNKLVQAGRWEMPAVVPIRRIEGTVLGLVGFGNIPRLVAPKAQAFGIKVVAYDPYAKPELFKAAGVESVDFDTLLVASDYVSVHAPLMPATRGLINAAAFGKMKKGAYIVNTARGPLIDEAALIAALDAGQVGGAALDVVASEPLAKDLPLLGRDNVIVSPHTAFYSIEALNELQTQMRERRGARAQRRKSRLPDFSADDRRPKCPAPFVSSVMRVEPQWIDYNGHLNIAYYNVLFDRAVDEIYELLGIGADYLKQHKHSTMAAEVHVRYLREIHEGTRCGWRPTARLRRQAHASISSSSCTPSKAGCRPPRRT